ncbi:hypothetical protein [Entomohabitans teleogrylli]|uniref:hypothetical protein n=1 Tax=Entomohabitans teleogrylli TaxID=1384589 RepID=UPI00073D7365|nr:hypothetical protein [Entomohabitans teleogrylli]
MIPDIRTFTRKYLLAAWLSVAGVSAVLTSSLIRNVPDIMLWEVIAGLGAICLSIVWGMMRDGPGYWAYSVYTLRMSVPSRQQAAPRRQPGGIAQIYFRPLWASAATLIAVTLLSCAIWPFGPAWRYWFIALLGVLVLPALMIWLLSRALPWWISALAEPRPTQRTRTLADYLREDLFFSLLINFALVLPIARKPAFSLAQGYASPAFIVAFTILLWAVMFFMFCFALRQRRYVMFGELLRGDIDQGFSRAPDSATRRRRKGIWRLSGWMVFTGLWSPTICLVFSALSLPPDFTSLYLCSLIPLVLIYSYERYQTLASGLREAQEMHGRYQELLDIMQKKGSSFIK